MYLNVFEIKSYVQPQLYNLIFINNVISAWLWSAAVYLVWTVMSQSAKIETVGREKGWSTGRRLVAW